MLAESYLHTLSPFLLRISGEIGLRWYGLAYLAGFVVAGHIMSRLVKTGRSPLARKKIDPGSLLTSLIVGVIVGGRLGFALFYQPQVLWTVGPSFPFWELLAIHKGGMASHGGMLGVLIASGWFVRKNNLDLYDTFHVADLAAFCATPGLFFGRLANFVNAELWGEPIATRPAPWWSVKYPNEMLPGHPDSVPSVVAEVAAAFPNEPANSIHTKLIEGDHVVQEAVKPLLTPYWPSQLVQALAEGPFLAAILCIAWWRPKQPGMIGVLFLCCYGPLRLLTEMIRQPDAGIERIFGLSRGQLLSVGMVLGGLLLLGLVRKSPRRDGGLFPPSTL
ncbi:MAG: prolipoprotein diacylglyceryl transferase [Planctomycetota bacterium]|nr:MAG: prolipoprotein diacylglyceryl transferase [Phycisphaera sp. TMED151]